MPGFFFPDKVESCSDEVFSFVFLAINILKPQEKEEEGRRNYSYNKF